MQHFTRNTTQVLSYCPTCNRKTMHRVDDRRLGPCLEHGARELSRKQERIFEKLEGERRQGSLF
jgi:ribosomal protein L44E